VLINEEHSFGRIFTGCFWDLIANLFGAAATENEATLLSAARVAGKLLIEAAKVAVVAPRFLQAIGRSIVLADQMLNGGANGLHIRNAFQAHDIMLGTSAMLARWRLPGPRQGGPRSVRQREGICPDGWAAGVVRG
jgi:Fungalysin metallopeptidase (M36)